jgi:hypothetical protein
MAVDGQLVARTVGELRATLPQAGDLLAGLGRVVEATRTVVAVDGTGLTLAHEDGQPRWVAVSDAAMELLEQIQHDFGEGPCLAAFAEDRVVAVERTYVASWSGTGSRRWSVSCRCGGC